MIDTNILLRFLLQDVPEQSQKAANLIKSAEAGRLILVVPGIVFEEVVFVCSKIYKIPRIEIAEILGKLISLSGVESLVPLPVLEQALNFFYGSKNIPWPDCIIAATALGNQITEIYSFDHHFDSFNGVTRLRP